MTITEENPSVDTSDDEVGKLVVDKSPPGANPNARGFCISRSLVAVVLIASAAVVGSLTYVFVEGDEDDDYHRQVHTEYGERQSLCSITVNVRP
jgi:hypothetical protein